MIYGIGTDVVLVRRIEGLLERYGGLGAGFTHGLETGPEAPPEPVTPVIQEVAPGADESSLSELEELSADDSALSELEESIECVKRLSETFKELSQGVGPAVASGDPIVGDGVVEGAALRGRDALRGGVAREVVRSFDLAQRTLKIQNVDAVTLREDVRLHLRVPSPCAMAEMNASLQQLAHRDCCHVLLLISG